MRQAAESRVSLRLESGVAHLDLGNGTRVNALGPHDWIELRELVRTLPTAGTSALVVRGVGGNFSAGFDISTWKGARPSGVDADFRTMETALRAIEDSPIPSIAVIEGFALGSGCQLALACDVRVLAGTARVGMPVAKLGIRLGPNFLQRLERAVGAPRATELVFTGRVLDAREAATWGLGVLGDEADEILAVLVDQIRNAPAGTLAGMKQARRRLRVQAPVDPEDPRWEWTVPSVFAEKVKAFTS